MYAIRSYYDVKCKNLSIWSARFLDTSFDDVDFSNAGAAYAIFNAVDFSSLNIDGAIFWNAKVSNSFLSKKQCEYLKKEEAILKDNDCK